MKTTGERYVPLNLRIPESLKDTLKLEARSMTLQMGFKVTVSDIVLWHLMKGKDFFKKEEK